MKIIKEREINQFLTKLNLRREEEDLDISSIVTKIISDVRKNGDMAVRNYTLKFDEVDIENIEVTKEEINFALNNINKKLYDSLIKAKKNIEEYHKIQIRKSKFIKKEGIKIGELITPIERVGIYVPGGKASYPSTVLMNVIPAKLARCKEIIMVTPPLKNGKIKDSVLVAAYISGVNKIYKVGGAQSIAALAYGTKIIKPVYKIVGPGNIYVACAKKLVSNKVGIDMIAGPSEILIICNKNSNPDFIAADLIAQAEHDERAAAICIAVDCDLDFIKKIEDSLILQIESSVRKKIINKSLINYGAIIQVESLNKAIEITNIIAPEHLEIMIEDESIVEKINSSGAIFLGSYTPEVLGDYFAGPNHTLPTTGTAKWNSPLGVDDFIKKTSYISYTREALENVKDDIITIANDEGLYGHANSIVKRFEV